MWARSNPEETLRFSSNEEWVASDEADYQPSWLNQMPIRGPDSYSVYYADSAFGSYGDILNNCSMNSSGGCGEKDSLIKDPHCAIVQALITLKFGV